MRGYIVKRGANSWRIQIELDRVGGKRHRRFVTVKGTRKDAQRELARLLVSADTGTLPADPTQATVGEYVTASLDSRADLSPKTLERYRELARHQIVPHVGEVKLQKLRPEHIEHWHAALLAKGLSARTVRHAHRLLSSVLKRAVENGAVARNVAAIRRPPAVEERELEILTPEHIAAVLNSLKGRTLHPIVSLALATGMRRGELLALQWCDVDLDAGKLRVERSVEETKAGLRIKPPKTKRGRRTITLPAGAIALLRAHKIEQMQLRLKLGQSGPPTLLFGTIDGALLSPNNVTRAWYRACRKAGLPGLSFHALRHTHASLLIAGGEDLLVVSRRLGHAKASVTLDVYAHLLDGADAGAAKTIEKALK